MSSEVLIVIAVVAIAATLLVAAWATSRRQRNQSRQNSVRLHEQFGTEYDRTVAELGSTRKAESELTARQERVSKFDIRHLTTDEGKTFSDEWLVVQASFVDDPSTAVHDADALIGKVMQARGYPVADYEQRSADMSVDHSPVLSHYRAAHDIALRGALGHADTEDLRQAVVSTHLMFNELVEKIEIAGKVEPVQAPSMVETVPVATATEETAETPELVAVR
jgi:FtsZ-interacting cell division protein ZipA